MIQRDHQATPEDLLDIKRSRRHRGADRNPLQRTPFKSSIRSLRPAPRVPSRRRRRSTPRMTTKKTIARQSVGRSLSVPSINQLNRG